MAIKAALMTLSFFYVGHDAYNKIGDQAFCNLDAAEFTAQCNYESLDSCQSYTMIGQLCARNPTFAPQHESVEPSPSIGLDSPALSLLVTRWKETTTLSWQNRWRQRWQQFWQRL